MSDISKIKLPSGSVYTIKDEVAREMISGGISFIVAWDGVSTPVVANIPAGVQVTYGGTTYTGTMAASSAQAGAFYLVHSKATETADIYDEYVVATVNATKIWERLGNTSINLDDLGDLAFKDDVSLDKSTVSVLTGATAALANGAVIFDTPTTQNVATSVTPTTSKLNTTTITGVTGSTTASKVTTTAKTASKATAATSQTTATGIGNSSSTNSDWLKGVSISDETLIIGAATMATQTTTQFTFADVSCTEVSASDITVPQADTNSTTVATGSVSSSGTGSSIVTNVSVGDTVAAVTAMPSASVGTTVTVTPSNETVLKSDTSIVIS